MSDEQPQVKLSFEIEADYAVIISAIVQAICGEFDSASFTGHVLPRAISYLKDMVAKVDWEDVSIPEDYKQFMRDFIELKV